MADHAVHHMRAHGFQLRSPVDIRLFIEAREQLAIAESALLVLDTDPDDLQAVDSMFRALHTIKGTSAFFGIERVTELAHLAESSLARVRSGAAVCGGELSNLLFRSIDMLESMFETKCARRFSFQYGRSAMPSSDQAVRLERAVRFGFGGLAPFAAVRFGVRAAAIPALSRNACNRSPRNGRSNGRTTATRRGALRGCTVSRRRERQDRTTRR